MAETGYSPPHVLIVGAGITGLLIAQGLKKEGIPFEIFESEVSSTLYRPREWGMSIQWGLPLLKDLLPDELFAQIHTAANDPYFVPPDPGQLPTWNGKTGELLKNVPLLRMYRMSRRKLRKLSAEGIDIKYGKKYKDVTFNDERSTVTAIFEDGTQATGSLLIGTDGAQSRVRTKLFGAQAEASKTPYAAVNLVVHYNDREKALFVRQAHPIMTMAIHPDGLWLWISIQDVPDPDDPTTWSFQLQTTWKKIEGEDVTSLANLKSKAQTFGEPFRSANLWIPDGTPIYSNNLSYWEPIPWDNHGGRILIAGDAAHPMTFQRGQGMNNGIADAANFVKLYKSAVAGEIGFSEAADAYQAEMIERAGEEVRVSKENTDMLHDWGRASNSPIMQRGGHPNEKKSQKA